MIDLDVIAADLEAPYAKALLGDGVIGDGPAGRLVRAVPVLVAEVKRLREHSVTLNSIAWKIASALGDVSADAETHMGDPVDEADRLIAAVERVRALHRRVTSEHEEPWCAECVGSAWPCPTIRALDGTS